MIQSTNGLSGWLVYSARKNPEGALLLAAGAVLLLRRSGTISAVADSHLAQRAAESVRTVAQSVTEKAGDAASKSRAGSEYVSETLSAATERTNQTAQRGLTSVRSTIEKIVQEQPFFVAMAGLIAGAGVAAVLPPSTLENDALKPLTRKVSDAVNYVGDEAKEALDRATDKFKDVAAERGLTSEGLKKMASEVASAAAPQLGGAREAND